MERKSKKITAFLLAFLMILSVCLPSAGSLGLNRVNAEADAGYEESAGMDLSNATGGDASTEAAQDPTEAEYITTGNALSGMPAPIANDGTPMPIAAGDDGLTVENFKVTVDGQELKEGDSLNNGQNLKVGFDWNIKNNSSTKSFSVDLSGDGISIDDYPETTLYDEQGREIGKWWIKDKQFHIDLDDKFASESYIEGGASVNATVDVEENGTETNKQSDFKIGDATIPNVNVDLRTQESQLSVGKSKPGNAYFDSDGNLCQPYRVTLSAQYGTVTLTDLKDTATGVDFFENSDITVTYPNGETKTYKSWEALNSDLQNKELNKGEQIIIDYEMKVPDKKGALSQNGITVTNQVSADYVTNQNNEKEADSNSEWGINVNKPSLGKGGEVTEYDDNGKPKKIKWTITLSLGILHEQDVDDSEIIDSIKDQLGKFLQATDTSLSLDNLKLSDFDYNEYSGYYTLTYETDVKDLPLNLDKLDLTNDVTVTFKLDEEELEYKAQGVVGVDPTDIIEKDFVSLDDGTKILLWKVSLQIPDDGTMTSVTITDNNDSVSKQTLIKSVKIGNQYVIQEGAVVDHNIIQNVTVTETEWQNNISFQFTDTYIESMKGKTIELFFESLAADDSLTTTNTYKNSVNVSYTFNGKEGSQNDSAEHTRELPSELVEKTGVPSETYRNAIDYQIRINLSDLNSKKTLTTDDDIKIQDLLPDGMKVIDGSVEADVINEWYNEYLNPPVWQAGNNKPWDWFQHKLEYAQTGQNLNIDIHITNATIESLKTSDAKNRCILVITYSTQLDQEGMQKLYETGKITYTNNASLSLNGDTPLASDSADVELESSYVVNKYNTYDGEKTPDIPYTIIINPDALDLSPSGDVLKGVDKSGDALVLKMNSVKIYEYVGTGDPEKDDSDASWSICKNATYVYNQKKHEITFTLPDNKALKIEYEMIINLYRGGGQEGNDWLTEENSYNRFSLFGVDSSKGLSYDSFNQQIQNPSAWAISKLGSITIYKFWTDENQMVALENSEFELWKCEYDETNLKITEPKSELIQKEIKVDPTTGTVTIDELAYDCIYALYETKSDDGFACNKDPYYFAMVDESQASSLKVPDYVDKDFHKGYIYYENFPSQAKLVLKKTLTSDDTTVDFEKLKDAVLKQDITFTVTDTVNSKTVGTYTLSEDFKYDETNHEFTLEDDIAAGTYTVTETATAPDGYVLESTTYTVTVTQKTGTGTTSSGETTETGSFTVQDGDTATVAFTNTYKKATGKLVLKKKLSGDSTVDLAKLKDAVLAKDITFTLKNTNDPTDVKEYKLSSKDFTYDEITHEFTLEDEIAAGTYTVTETATAPDGYVLESTTYTVTVTPGTGTTSSGDTIETGKFTVQDGDIATVAFMNTYKKAAGKLVLKKTLATDGTVDLAKLKDAVLAKDITFTLKNQDDPSDVKVYKLSSKDFTYDETTHEFTLEDDIAAGTYTVTETATAPDGYVLESTTYTVTITPKTGAGTTSSGDTTETGKFTVQDGDTATVAFMNTYKKAAGKLVLKKTLATDGTVDLDKLKDAVLAKDITFTLKNQDDPSDVKVYKLSSKDFTYDETTHEFTLEDGIAAGTYIVTETATAPDGYVLESTTYTVTVTPKTGEGTTSSGDAITTDEFTVQDGDTATVAFTNTYKKATGKLVLKKKLSGDSTVDLAKLKDAVLAKDITFTLKNTNNPTDVKEYKLSSKDFTYDEITHEFTLDDEIAAGTYTVTETATAPDGYVLESTTYTVTVTPKTGEGTTSSGDAITTDEFTVQDGDTATVTFTNTYKKATGKLVIQKTIDGDVTEEEARGALQFTVKKADGTELGTYKLSEFDHVEGTKEYTLTLNNLDEGDYIITETVTDVTGKVLESVTYSLNGSEPKDITNNPAVTAEVTAGSSTTVAFKDNYINEDTAGKLVLQKTIEGSVTKEEAEGALQFTVKNEKTGTVNTYYLKDFDYNEETGIFTKELDVAAGEYTVTESVRDVNGHVLKSVSYTVSGSEAKSTDDKGSVGVNVEKQGKVTVAFKDAYEKATGTLVLKKTIKGAITKEEAEGALEFTVKNNTTKEEKTYTLKDFTYDEKTGEYTLTLPLEEGGYTVTESTKDVNGYVLDSVTYSVNGGDATKGDTVTTDVKAKETVTVAFEDDYSKSKTESSSEQITETTIITTENVTETETQTSAKSEVKTGDKAPIVLVCILLLVSAAAGGIVIGKKMKNKKDQ